jgi:hypothetical protein
MNDVAGSRDKFPASGMRLMGEFGMSFRNSSRLGRHRRFLVASVAFSALILVPPPPAFSFIATAMAVAGLASSILSAGGKGSDVSATAILAQMKMVEALHARMDEVDASLALIMTQLNNIKKDIREELEHDRDLNRSESVSGKTETMVGLLKDLAAAQNIKDAKEIDRKKAQIDAQIVTLQNERNALRARTDFVLPTMVATMVTEVNALRAIHAPKNEVRRVLLEYDGRLAMAQDVSRKGSLADLRHELEAQQAALAQAIAGEAEGQGAKELLSGIFPWIVHTKVHDEGRADQTTCWEPPREALKFEGEVQPIPIPTEPEIPRPQQIDRVPCLHHYTVTVQEHSRELKRAVSLSPLTDSNAAGVFTLAITYPTPVQSNPIAGARTHPNSDADFEKQQIDSDKQLQQKVTEFNDRAAAILRLEQLENIVSTARGLIVRWDDAAAGKAVAFADTVGTHSFEVVDLVEQDRRDAAVSDRIAAQDKARREAWKVVEDARHQVSETIERAQKEKWRSDWIAGLSIFRASLQTYVAVDREYFSSQQSERAKTSGPRKATAVVNGASGIANAVGAGAKKSTASSTKPSKPETSGTKSLVERTAADPLRTEDNFARVKRVEQIISEVGHKKLDYWTKLPGEPTHEELLLLEGMEHLDKMGDTEADRFVRDEQVTPGTLVGDMAKGAAGDGPMGAAKEALTDVIKPAILADDTLLGEQSRNAMRKQLNDLYRPYFIRRFIDDVSAGTDYSQIGKDVCMSKDGCIVQGPR